MSSVSSFTYMCTNCLPFGVSSPRPKLERVADRLVLVRERRLDAVPEARAARAHERFAQVAAHHVESERHGQAVALTSTARRSPTPSRSPSARYVSWLVDDDAGVHVAREHGARDLVEHHLHGHHVRALRCAAAAPPW